MSEIINFFELIIRAHVYKNMSLSLESLGDLKRGLELSPSSNMPVVNNTSSGIPKPSTKTLVISAAILIVVGFYVYKWYQDKQQKQSEDKQPVNVQVLTDNDTYNTASTKPVPGSRYAGFEEDSY